MILKKLFELSKFSFFRFKEIRNPNVLNFFLWFKLHKVHFNNIVTDM